VYLHSQLMLDWSGWLPVPGYATVIYSQSVTHIYVLRPWWFSLSCYQHLLPMHCSLPHR